MIEIFILRPFKKIPVAGWSFLIVLVVITFIYNYKVFLNRKKEIEKYTLLQYIKLENGYIFGSLAMWYVGIVFTMTILTRSYNMFLYKRFIPLWSWYASVKEIVTGDELIVTEQILANIAMMMPLGFLLYFANNTNVKEGLFYGFLFSVYMELLQLMFQLGVFEWDDMVHNALGCALGVCAAKLLMEGIVRIKKRAVRREK